MNIAILGAGIGGMSAAHDLQKAGHTVTIFEAAGHVGGLAAGFKEPHWASSVEQFYHHWFASDKDMLGLMDELGLRQKVVYRRPLTVVYHKDKFYPLDSPLKAITFPGYSFINMVRFGLVTVYLKYLASWRPLEASTAHEWIRKVYGQSLNDVLLEPMLIGKFGPHYKEVNMAWFWARFKARSTRLGTYQGGFQAFSDQFAGDLRRRGVEILDGDIDRQGVGSCSIDQQPASHFPGREDDRDCQAGANGIEQAEHGIELFVAQRGFGYCRIKRHQGEAAARVDIGSRELSGISDQVADHAGQNGRLAREVAALAVDLRRLSGQFKV